ncbi:hypothetical protein NE237_019163 [Protea cynaroides]|uniref:3-hydroxyacyl-CoA dehydrogenase NAD binding domain-containing protein n=1 Tax=Protea cynaroides TaxID=273540 RepID=A0A9Q0KBC7_9MAGN|nr:hypothetical protein NE237_019163 [Protea cynaroides]
MVSMIFDARGTIVDPQFTFAESFEVENDMDWPSSTRNCQVFSKTLRGVYLRVLMAEINENLSFLLNSSTVIVFMEGEMLLIFISSALNSYVPGVADGALAPKRVNKVAILGGGLMGFGMATALILSNCHVILKEVNEKFLKGGIGRVKGVV